MEAVSRAVEMAALPRTDTAPTSVRGPSCTVTRTVTGTGVAPASGTTADWTFASVNPRRRYMSLIADTVASSDESRNGWPTWSRMAGASAASVTDGLPATSMAPTTYAGPRVTLKTTASSPSF